MDVILSRIKFDAKAKTNTSLELIDRRLAMLSKMLPSDERNAEIDVLLSWRQRDYPNAPAHVLNGG